MEQKTFNHLRNAAWIAWVLGIIMYLQSKFIPGLIMCFISTLIFLIIIIMMIFKDKNDEKKN